MFLVLQNYCVKAINFAGHIFNRYIIYIQINLFSPTNNILFHGKNKGSLPLVMMFDLPDLIEIDDVEVQRIQEELDVGISIKPKQRQSNKSVMIKAQVNNNLTVTYKR